MEAVFMSALLEVRHVSRSFQTTLAVNDVSFSVQEGELLGLMGPNGAGKSTLFNLVAGVLPPSAGEIVYDRKPVTGWKAHDMARVGVARTFQIPKPYRQLSVIENVMLSAFLREKSVARARKLAEATLHDVGLDDYADSPANSLTVGLLKRLEVARALAMRPKLVLFDEIMAGLTPTEVGAMTKFVAGLPARGITVIWVEHVLYAIMKTATRMIVINRGKQIAEGTPATIARDPAVVKAYLGEEMNLA
jgi:branched-chain amino acid transport system ATP-binding protein